jgi:hypothetical protein
MKVDDQESYGRSNTSPLAMESAKTEFMRHKRIFEGINKKLVFEDEQRAASLLDERQVKE